MELRQLAAFCEYVVRPMSEDWRTILEKVQELKLPLHPELIRDIVAWCLVTHVLLEVVKWAVYVSITWLVCRTVVQVL